MRCGGPGSNLAPGPPLVPDLRTMLLRSFDGGGVPLGGRVGFDLVTDFEGPLRLRGLVYMDADLFSGRILDGVVLTLDDALLPMSLGLADGSAA
jgi:hypothetical protein